MLELTQPQEITYLEQSYPISEDSSVIITTHHIADVEKILDDVIFLNEGKIELNSAVEDLREERGKSVDEIFRETYICLGGII